MYNSILTNMTSLAIQRNLNNSQVGISTSLKRMSTGIKLNQAKDGAADYAITSKMENKVSGLDIAINNLSHGENLLNIADDVLDNMVQQVTRIRDLSLQAKNNTLSKEELKALQEEINQISKELERQRQTTKYNDASIFETKALKEVVVEKPYEKRVAYIESTGTQYIDTGYIPNSNTEIITNVAFTESSYDIKQMGCIAYENGKYSKWNFGLYHDTLTAYKGVTSSAGDVIKAYDNEFHQYYLSNNQAGIDENINTVSQTTNSNVNFTLFARNGFITAGGTPSVGYHTKSRLQDFKIYEGSTLVHSYIPVVDYDGKVALYDEITKEMLYNQGSGEFIAGEEVEDVVEKHQILTEKEPTVLQIGNNAGVDHTISINLGFEFGDLNFNVSNSFNANFAIKRADELINALTKKRADVGATLNRINSANQLQTTNKINLAYSKSTIKDSDIAKESTNLAHNQILQQVSASLFTQANQINGNLALRLLAG